MKIEHWPEIARIKSIAFGSDKPCKNIYVYLHGSGGFRTGYKGQYEYPDFASLLQNGDIELEQPFVVACCMDREHWFTGPLVKYLSELSARFNGAKIDIIGYSRGGMGVYGLLQSGAALNSATIINSRVSESANLPKLPVHIIHATDDQHASLEVIEAFVFKFGNEFTSLTAWPGDHFSIASIAISGIWRRPVPQETTVAVNNFKRCI